MYIKHSDTFTFGTQYQFMNKISINFRTPPCDLVPQYQIENFIKFWKKGHHHGLWPQYRFAYPPLHTIAVEDDGDEVNSEDIGLKKFLACYTKILTDCKGKVEAAGRSALLHAVSTVYEYLPWSEARTFHNLTMVKLEQKRIN